MSSRYSSCFSLTSPNNFCFSTWEKPTIAFSGVLSSWLMLARKSDLCWDATSSAFVRSATRRLQAGDQLLHALGHLVEGRGERAQLVLAIQLDALVVGAGADRLGRHLQALDRAHEAAREQDRESDRRRDEGGDQKGGAPDLPAQGSEGRRLGLLHEHFPAGRGHDGPCTQDLAVAEILTGRRPDGQIRAQRQLDLRELQVVRQDRDLPAPGERTSRDQARRIVERLPLFADGVGIAIAELRLVEQIH